MTHTDIAPSVRPISHESVRHLLTLIEKGIELQDPALIDATLSIASNRAVVSYETYNLLQIYSYILEQASDTDTYYSLYSTEDIEHAKKALYKEAYGDFNEALLLLEQDLFDIDPTIRRGEKHSNIFRPDYFTDEQQAVWHELRAPVEAHMQSEDSDLRKEADEARMKLRSYQQQAYGPLIPTMIATYVKKEGNTSHGVSVRLAGDEPTLNVDSSAPFNEELDEYFIDIHPVESIHDFTPASLPSEIGGYTLQSTSTENLFRYELDIE